jgi:hypothetical protein
MRWGGRTTRAASSPGEDVRLVVVPLSGALIEGRAWSLDARSFPGPPGGRLSSRS